MGLLGIDGIEQEAVLGRGAYGVVYRAWQPALQRHVAVKVLVGAFDDAALRRFERECATVGSLSDEPGILTVHAAGRTADGSPYLVTPYLPGGSLADRLRDGPLPPGEVVAAGVAVGRALAAAHARGVLHLDVKPANVLLDGRGEPRLADFGIARFIDSEQRGHTATIAGTPGFAAPEIFEGEQPSVRSDVYGLGATLHALAGGQAPFTLSGAGGLSGLLRQIASDPPPDLRPLGVPGPLCEVIERAMAKDPAQRYATVEDLVADLEPLAGAPVGPPAHAGAAPGPGSGSASGSGPDTLDESGLASLPRPARRAPALAGRWRYGAAAVAAVAVAGIALVALATGGGDGGGATGGGDGGAGTAAGAEPAQPAGTDGQPGGGTTGTDGQPAGGTDGTADQPDAGGAQPGDGELWAWLGVVHEVNRRVLLAAPAEIADVCRDGLEQVEERYGGVPLGAGAMVPQGLAATLAAQPEPARGLWSELIDAYMRRYRDCAAGDLSPEEDEASRTRVLQAQAALLEVVQAGGGPPAGADR